MIHEYIIKVDESKPDIMGGVPLTEPAKELIRCRDCKHSKSYQNGTMFGCEFGNGLREPDWFCADGEKKDA